MTVLTAKQLSDLNRMNEASRRAGGLGNLLLGGSALPDAGTMEPMAVVKYSSTPALASATGVHAAITLIQTNTQTITTAITNPDFPRIVTVKGNDSNVTGNVVISGTNFNDVAITETIALSGASVVSGAKAFKTVTSIVVPPYAVAGTETVSIGTGAKIGFPVAITNASQVIAKSFNGTVDAGTVTAAATIEGSIYAAAGTFDGAKILALTFLTA